MYPSIHRCSSLALLLASLTLSASVQAQDATGQRSPDVAPVAVDALVQGGVDELRIRLAPLALEELTVVEAELMGELRAQATELADAMIQRMRLRRAADADPDALVALDALVATLLSRKSELASRMNVVLEAVEQKGGDVSAARGYVAAVDALYPEDDAATSAEGEEKTGGDDEVHDPEAAAEETARARTAELVAIIRAEPPAHERPVPWEVPLSEFELELQPLPLKEILERLGKWREMLQREVRKRVRVDILLNDADKLEETRGLYREAATVGAASGEVPLASIKSRLAEQSQDQQRIVNAIVERMEIAIRLVELRGGDAKPYANYIASATGQRLNLADLTILRAQVFAWLRSPDGGVKIGLNIAKFLGIVFVFWIFSRLLGGITGAAITRVPKSSSLLRPVLAGIVRRVTFFVGLVVGVSMLGVNIGPLLALIGAAGLVIGLALQGTLSNFASGILILLNRPYDVGDVIDAGGVFGKVEAMNLVSTTVLTFDNQLMLVPNNQIWNGVIKNVTGRRTRRVDLTFGIGYADDMQRAMEIIREVITAHPKVHADPAPVIRVNELGDNSVNIIARPWTGTSDYWDVYWDLMYEVKRRFDEDGVNIPFPQRDVHLPGAIEVKLLGGGEADAALAGVAGQPREQ